jgi:hypothetical protein
MKLFVTITCLENAFNVLKRFHGEQLIDSCGGAEYLAQCATKPNDAALGFQ